MKTIIITALAHILSFIVCKSQTLTLSYDAAGNRISKQIVNPINKPVIVGDTVACARSNVVLAVHNCASYLWKPGGETDSVLNVYMDNPKQYKVYGYNDIGCKDSTLFDIAMRPVPYTGPITGPATGVVGHIDTFRAPIRVGSFYDWTVTGGSIIWGYGTPVVAVQWTEPGTATVKEFEYVDSFVCTTDTAMKMLDVTPFKVLSDEIINTAGFSFKTYPNPTTGNVTVAFAEEDCQSVGIMVINSVGVVLYTEQLTGSGSYNIRLQESVFPATGIYTILLTTEKRNLHQKIVVEK